MEQLGSLYNSTRYCSSIQKINAKKEYMQEHDLKRVKLGDQPDQMNLIRFQDLFDFTDHIVTIRA